MRGQIGDSIHTHSHPRLLLLTSSGAVLANVATRQVTNCDGWGRDKTVYQVEIDQYIPSSRHCSILQCLTRNIYWMRNCYVAGELI